MRDPTAHDSDASRAALALARAAVSRHDTDTSHTTENEAMTDETKDMTAEQHREWYAQDAEMAQADPPVPPPAPEAAGAEPGETPDEARERLMHEEMDDDAENAALDMILVECLKDVDIAGNAIKPGRRLRRFREKSGKSMGALAAFLGCSVPQVSDIERDVWDAPEEPTTPPAPPGAGVAVHTCARCQRERWNHYDGTACPAFVEATGAGVAGLVAAAEALLESEYFGDWQSVDGVTVWRLSSDGERLKEALARVRATPGALSTPFDADVIVELQRERDRLTAEVATLRKSLDESRGLGYLVRAERAEAEVAALKADLATMRRIYDDAHAALDAAGAPPKQNPDGVSIGRSVAERIGLWAATLRRPAEARGASEAGKALSFCRKCKTRPAEPRESFCESCASEDAPPVPPVQATGDAAKWEAVREAATRAVHEGKDCKRGRSWDEHAEYQDRYTTPLDRCAGRLTRALRDLDAAINALART